MMLLDMFIVTLNSIQCTLLIVRLPHIQQDLCQHREVCLTDLECTRDKILEVLLADITFLHSQIHHCTLRYVLGPAWFSVPVIMQLYLNTLYVRGISTAFNGKLKNAESTTSFI